AEDGIRDRNVTGVQTCALPISMKGTSLYDFENKRYLQEIGKDDRMYEDADGFIFAFNDIRLQSGEELYREYFRNQVQYESNPFQYWSNLDENIIDHFELEEKEHTYIQR